MSDLKTCPFCGASPRTEMSVSKMGGGEDKVDFYIRCPDCGTAKLVRLTIHGYVNFVDVDIAIDDVIKAWNQRAETAASKE